MKTLQVLRKGNTQTLLTVATDRITIKFKGGLNEHEEQSAQAFLMKVAGQLESTRYTLRGHMSNYEGTLQITMKGGGVGDPVSKHFREDSI